MVGYIILGVTLVLFVGGYYVGQALGESFANKSFAASKQVVKSVTGAVVGISLAGAGAYATNQIYTNAEKQATTSGNPVANESSSPNQVSTISPPLPTSETVQQPTEFYAIYNCIEYLVHDVGQEEGGQNPSYKWKVYSVHTSCPENQTSRVEFTEGQLPNPTVNPSLDSNNETIEIAGVSLSVVVQEEKTTDTFSRVTKELRYVYYYDQVTGLLVRTDIYVKIISCTVLPFCPELAGLEDYRRYDLTETNYRLGEKP